MEIKIFKVVYGSQYCNYCSDISTSAMFQDITDWEEVTDKEYYELEGALSSHVTKDKFVVVRKIERDDPVVKQTVDEFKDTILKQVTKYKKQQEDYNKKKESQKKARELKRLEQLKKKYEGE